MLSRLPTVKHPVLFAAVFLCLHGLSIFVFNSDPMAASYPFMVLAPFMALAACCWGAWKSTPVLRRGWIAMCVGLSLWSIGSLLSAWEDVFQHLDASTAYVSDFVYFLYGAPVLLGISTATEDKSTRIFFWLDGFQLALTTFLIYLKIFSVVPFSGNVAQPISAQLLTTTYNIENLILIVCATLRLLASPREGQQRHFYRILCSFLWVYGAAVLLYNHMIDATQNHPKFYDLLVDIPFLLLAGYACVVPARSRDTLVPRRKGQLSLFIDNVSPIFFTLAMLALGFTVMRDHAAIGTATIIAATVVYGVRATLIQSRYIQSQEALQEARDRLEEMSLRDGLTGVANRRCFDLALESEWNRASRMQHSLSLLMVDVDHFKNLNDTYGHRVGDECLKEIASGLNSVLPRSGDLLARYGGEEFAVILPGTSRAGAEAVAARMQAAIRSLNIENITPIGRFTTVSIGVAVFDFPAEGSPDHLVEASDRALYRAKQNGRNRIEFASIRPAFNALGN